MSVRIRNIEKSDRATWEPLWKGYQFFYKVELPDSVTDTTWERFFDPNEPVHCLVAEDEKNLMGIVHYIFHRNTWMTGPVCYLQDLFTSEAARGQGVGRKLIESVYDKAKEAGSPRVYWMTHETNTQAMILYDKVAEKSGFLQYRKQI
jgi:GNAT superfamily N-acetyltransferase